jgi:uncharacterized protein YcfJ
MTGRQNITKSSWSKTLVITLLLLLTSGCQLTSQENYPVGPQVNFPAADTKNPQDTRQASDKSLYLDVAVPVFDPGIPKDYQKMVEQGIWPQLRRAEANRFALNTKNALAATGAFGTVNVTPDSQASAELYVLGTIIQSNSETVKIDIKLVDISGKVWRNKSFKHQVSGGFYRDLKNDDKDPYAPIFDDIADYVVKQLDSVAADRKKELQQINDLRFAQSLAPEAFAEHLTKTSRGGYQVKSLPSEDDPMLQRVKTLQVQEQFSLKIDDSYKTWQQEAFVELARAEEANNKSIMQGVLGGLLIVGGIIADKNSDSTGSDVIAVASTIGGALVLKSAMENHAQGEVHQAVIDELGTSIDIEMSPQVIAIEDKTIELTGNAQEQYSQWRQHLQRIYRLEQTPDVQL